MNLKYTGSNSEVTVYGDGEVVVHTTLTKGHRGEQVLVVRGSVQLSSLPPLDLKVIVGPCTVTVKGSKAKTLKSGAKLKLAAGSIYTIKGEAAILICIPKPGPGLDDPPPGGGLGGAGGTGPH